MEFFDFLRWFLYCQLRIFGAESQELNQKSIGDLKKNSLNSLTDKEIISPI